MCYSTQPHKIIRENGGKISYILAGDWLIDQYRIEIVPRYQPLRETLSKLCYFHLQFIRKVFHYINQNASSVCYRVCGFMPRVHVQSVRCNSGFTMQRYVPVSSFCNYYYYCNKKGLVIVLPSGIVRKLVFSELSTIKHEHWSNCITISTYQNL